jgi:3-isopropylmalate dehydrogenase
VLSAALLLAHLGFSAAAAQVESAVAADLAARGATVRSTSEVGDSLAAGAIG